MLDAVQTQPWAHRLYNLYIRQETIGEKKWGKNRHFKKKKKKSVSQLEIEVIPG